MTHPVIGRIVAVWVAAALVALALGQPASATPAAAEQPQQPAPIAPELRGVGGVVDVVVKVDGAGTVPDRAAHTAARSLQLTADRAQQPLLEFAESRAASVRVLQRFWLTNAVVLRVDTTRTDLERIAEVSGVERLYPNFEVTLSPPKQEKLDNALGAGPRGSADTAQVDTTYGLAQINAPEVWSAYGTKGAGAKVAVLDTGVDATHPDIDLYTEDPADPTYPGGWAEFDEDGGIVAGSQPHDSGSHGTHVSGTVAGTDAGGEAIGVAPGVDLLHGLVLPGGSGTFAQIMGGMQWAVVEDADVISMSLGADGHYAAFIDPVRNAEAAGSIVVAAIGNSGHGVSGTPGNIYESFAVGASSQDLGIAYFSGGETIETTEDWGEAAPDDWPETYVVPDVAAPGVAVRSAEPGGGYDLKSGTSMATPHVAGAIGLMISAAGGELSVRRIKEILLQTAVKPADCEPSCTPREGRDTRYGAGIIDAKAAADQAVLDSGVSGTVTDSAGAPLPDVTVTLGDFQTETGGDGQYTIYAAPGSYDVTAEGFGHDSVTKQVTVVEDTFTTGDFVLPDAVDGRIGEPPPLAVEGGDEVSAVLEVAHLDTLTVEIDGTYSPAEATLRVNGAAYGFNEPITFDDLSGDLTVTVATTTGTSGTFSLRHTLAGPGDTVEVTTGPTEVFAELSGVAVIDSDDGYGQQTAAMLDARLPDFYDVDVVPDEDALDAIGAHKVFVVQDLDPAVIDVERFLDETSSDSIGVIWLDQQAPSLESDVSDAIPALSRITGDPATTNGMTFDLGYPFFQFDQHHPIFYGVGAPDEKVIVHTGGPFTGGHTWFGGYSGTQLANVGHGGGISGSAIAIDPETATILASSLGRTAGTTNEDYTAEADRILANAVRLLAGDGPPVTMTAGAPAQLTPGQATTATFDVTGLKQVEIDLADQTTLPASGLTLTVEGAGTVDFGEPVTFEAPVSQQDLDITVQTANGAVGTFALEYTFVAGPDDETVGIATRRTAVYDPPLQVPGEVPTIQDADDLAVPDETVVVADGTYLEQVFVSTPGLTLRAADGATPLIRAPQEATGAVVRVLAEDVTVRGVAVDAAGVRTGIQIDRARVHVADTHVRNASYAGILPLGDYQKFDEQMRVEHNTITDSRYGIRMYYSENSAVVANTIKRVTTGVELVYANDHTVIENNTIDGSQTGIHLLRGSGGFASEDNRVAANHISNTEVGIDVEGAGSAKVTRNHIQAATGVHAATAPDGLTLRLNDLSASTVMVANAGEDILDARLNYYGARGPAEPEAGFDGAVQYDPFLTVAPEQVDDPEQVTEIATDVTMAGGQAYTLGIPGPTEQSIWDILAPDFEGEVYRYAPRPNRWLPVRGNGRWSRVQALDAFKVVPSTDTRAVLSFQTSGRDPRPVQRLQRGWNFVAAPRYGPVEEAFADSTARLVEASRGQSGEVLAAPASQLGAPGKLAEPYRFGTDSPGPSVDAVSGYLVRAGSPGRISATVPANPTMAELYAGLGLSLDVRRTSPPTRRDAAQPAGGIKSATASERNAITHALAAALDITTDDNDGLDYLRRQLKSRPTVIIAKAIRHANPAEQQALIAAVAEAVG